jgi:2-haloacid dehalogenase
LSRPTILFDINETVLDLSTLQPSFSTAFGSPKALKLWFVKLLHTSTVCISTNVKSDFASLAAITLDSVAAQFGISLTEQMKKELLSGFAHLPAHADIKPALALLKDSGFKTVAFSNSSNALITQQIANAGLNPYFDDILSVEKTGSFKPNPKVYLYASEHLGIAPEALRLVAAHDWDTHGAMAAGLEAAFIARSPTVYNPLFHRPTIEGTTMLEVVDKIVALDR